MSAASGGGVAARLDLDQLGCAATAFCKHARFNMNSLPQHPHLQMEEATGRLPVGCLGSSRRRLQRL